MSKYGNVKVTFDGIVFDSKKERERFIDLRMLERAGKIENLELQPEYELIPKSRTERAVKYRGDFRYIENGKVIVEDVKSTATAKDKAYIIKRKLMKWRCPDVEFREVK